MMKNLVRAAALLVALLYSGPAISEEAGPWHQAVGAVRVSVLSGFPDLFGVSAALTALRPLEIEVGGSTLIVASSTYARAGVGVPVLNTRDSRGKGWTLHVEAMAGYRYFATVPLDVSYTYHGITLNTGLNAVSWFGPHLGLDLQLVLGGVYWVHTTQPSAPPYIPDARISVGLAF